MTVDAATLSVIVKSDGIATTTQQLDALGTSADNAEKKTKRLTDSIDAGSSRSAKLATESASEQVAASDRMWFELTDKNSKYYKGVQSQAELHNNKVFGYLQAEAIAENAAKDKAVASERASFLVREKALADHLERQRALNASFAALSAQAQLSTAKRAMNYGIGAEEKYGGAAATLATAEGIALLGKNAEEASHKVHTLNFANSTFVRELMVMAHELSQGNYKRFAGSFMVLLNSINAAQIAIAAFGIATLAVFAGAVIGAGLFIFEVVKGALEVDKFNKALVLTGGFAGATRDSLESMAESIKSNMTGGIHAAKTMLEGLAATGHFTGGVLEAVGKAALTFAELSGQSSAEVIKHFEGMKGNVSAWAAQQNESYHFIDAATYEYIRTLELQGKHQEAVMATLRAMNDTMNTSGRHVGVLTAIVGGLALAWKNVSYWAGNVGAGDSDGEKVKKAMEAVSAAKKDVGQRNVGDIGYDAALTRLTEARKNAKSIIKQANDEEFKAGVTAQQKENDARGVAGGLELDALKKRIRSKEMIRAEDAANIQRWADDENLSATQHGKALLYTQSEINRMIELDAAKNKDHSAHKAPADDSRMKDLNNDLKATRIIYEQEGQLLNDRIKKSDDMERYDKEGRSAALAERELYREAEKITTTAFYNNSMAELDAFVVKAGKNNTELAEIDTKRKDKKNEYTKAMEAIEAKSAADRIKTEFKSTRNQKFEDDTGKLARDAASVGEAADALMEYGSMGKQSATELAKLEIVRAKLNATDHEGIIAIRMTAAALKDTNMAYMDLAKVAVKLEEEEALRNAYSVAGVIGAETAKVVARQAASDKMTNMAIHDAEVVLASLKPGTDAYNDQAEALKKLIALKAVVAGKTSIEFKIVGLSDMATMLNSAATAAGKLGTAFKGVQAALSGMGAATQRLAAAEKLQNTDAREATTQRIGAYGDMAQSAANFFDKQSTAYKTLEGISQAFHLIELARSAIQFAAAAPAAIAKAGAQTGWWGAIAMAAAMAALGYAAAGGFNSTSGDGTSAAERQKVQGTGTVLGDDTAKSDSIKKSLDLLSKNSDITLPISQGMLTALNNISLAIGGFAQLVFRTSGLQDGTNFGIKTGTLSYNNGGDPLGASGINLGGILGKLQNLWGKNSRDITDGGININGSMGQLSSGQGASQYANVQETSSSWFGLVKDTKNSTQSQALSDNMANQISLVFKNMGAAVALAGEALGKNTGEITSQITSFVQDIGKVSLKDLKGQALTDAINAVISSASDKLAQAIMPGLKDFQQVGEGYFQTLVRVASGTESAKVSLERLGIVAIGYTSVINKQGDVATEIVRQSLIAKEGLNGVGLMLQTLGGAAADIITTYKALLDIRKDMSATGLNGSSLSVSTVKGAGGLAELGTGAAAFRDKYFTDAEKANMATRDLSDTFAKLGWGLPKTKDDFKNLVQSIDTSSAAGQKLQGQLLALAGSFSDLKALEVTAYGSQVSSIQTSIDSLKAFQTSILAFRDSLLLGSLSVLTPMQKLQEAQKQYETTLASAKNGDVTAQGRLQSDASAFLSASQTANASGSAYTDAANKVQSDLTSIANIAGAQVTDAQRQLDALNKQINGITTLNATALTIQQSIDALRIAIGGGSSTTYVAGTGVVPANTNANSSTDALAAQVKSLQDEVAGLRADQNAQTAALIQANYDANARAAAAFADGVAQAQKDAAWAASNTTYTDMR
jgi:hypothetical protein